MLLDNVEKINDFRQKLKYEGLAEYEIESIVARCLLYDDAVGYISQEERNKIAEDDFGWPEERKFPVTNQEHLDAAVRLIGRAPKDKQEMIKRNIKRIAIRKKLSLPDSWVNE